MARFDLSKYDTVADRIKQFRADYPKGAILTRIVPELSTFNEVVCEAEIWLDLNDPRPVARDIAAEWRGENFKDGANLTAWHENAATSAIGRALDAAGYSKAKEGGRASREEMQKVERHSPQTQNQQPPSTAPTNLRVVETQEEQEPLSAWEQLNERAREFGFESKDTNDYLMIANELCTGDAATLKGDERWMYAAGENAIAWESAIEAVKAKKQANGRKAVAS